MQKKASMSRSSQHRGFFGVRKWRQPWCALLTITAALVGLFAGQAQAQPSWAGGDISFSVEPHGWWTLRWQQDPVAAYTSSPGPMSLEVYMDCDLNRQVWFGGSDTFPLRPDSDDLVVSIADSMGSYAGGSTDWNSLCFYLNTGRPAWNSGEQAVDPVSDPGVLEVSRDAINEQAPTYGITGLYGYQQNLFGQPKVLGSDSSGNLLMRGSPFTRQSVRGSLWATGTPSAGKELALIIDKPTGNTCPGGFTTGKNTGNFAPWVSTVDVTYYPQGSCLFDALIYEVPEGTAEGGLLEAVQGLTPVFQEKIDVGTDRVTVSSYADCTIAQVTSPGTSGSSASYDITSYQVDPDNYRTSGCDTSAPVSGTSKVAGWQYRWDKQPTGTYVDQCFASAIL